MSISNYLLGNYSFLCSKFFSTELILSLKYFFYLKDHHYFKNSSLIFQNISNFRTNYKNMAMLPSLFFQDLGKII